MTRSSGRNWPAIGCAALLGASIAFPLGLILGDDEPGRENPRPASRAGPPPDPAPPARDVYSPRITSDPYVVEQHRRVLRALEAECRQSRQHCTEAEQARRRIEEAERGR